MRQFTVPTESRDQFVDITARIAAEVKDRDQILRGLVTVFSEIGKGTTFDLFLPLRVAPSGGDVRRAG